MSGNVEGSVSSVESMLLGFDSKLKEMERTLSHVMSDLTEEQLYEEFDDHCQEQISNGTKKEQVTETKHFLYSEYTNLLHENELLLKQVQASKAEIHNLSSEKDCALAAIEHLQQLMSNPGSMAPILPIRSYNSSSVSFASDKNNDEVKETLIRELTQAVEVSKKKLDDSNLTKVNLLLQLEESKKENEKIRLACDELASLNASSRFMIEDLSNTLENTALKSRVFANEKALQGSSSGRGSGLLDQIDHAHKLLKDVLLENSTKITILEVDLKKEKEEILEQKKRAGSNSSINVGKEY